MKRKVPIGRRYSLDAGNILRYWSLFLRRIWICIDFSFDLTAIGEDLRTLDVIKGDGFGI